MKMRSAIRNACGAATHSHYNYKSQPRLSCSLLNPKNPLTSSLTNTLIIIQRPQNVVVRSPAWCHTLSEAETHAPPFNALMDKQFLSFRQHLDESGSLRDRIRGVATEIESTNRQLHSLLLLVHQSHPMPGRFSPSQSHFT